MDPTKSFAPVARILVCEGKDSCHIVHRHSLIETQSNTALLFERKPCIVVYSLYSDYLSQSHSSFGNLVPFPLKSDISGYFRFPEIRTPINVRSHKRFKSSTLRKRCMNKDKRSQKNLHAVKVMCLGECTFSGRYNLCTIYNKR